MPGNISKQKSNNINEMTAEEIRTAAEDILKDKASVEYVLNIKEGIESRKADNEAVERLNYYGDTNIYPNDESMFEFSVIGTGKASVTFRSDKSGLITDGTVVLPYKWENCMVTKIGYGAFMNKNCNAVLKKVIIPSTVSEIGSYAFRSCEALTDINIPGSVTTIGTGVFWDCKKFNYLPVLNHVSEIGQAMFVNCDSLTDILIPENITLIRQEAFSDCNNLKTVNILNDSIQIADDAFKKCHADLTFVCNQGSEAEEYAKNNGYKIAYNIVTNEILDNKVDKKENRCLVQSETKKNSQSGKTWDVLTLKCTTDDSNLKRIVIPKYISDLENDSGYLTESDVKGLGVIKECSVLQMDSGTLDDGMYYVTDADVPTLLLQTTESHDGMLIAFIKSQIRINSDGIYHRKLSETYAYEWEQYSFIRSENSGSGGGKDEIYIGTTEPTGGQEIWINPNGEEIEIITSEDVYLKEEVDNKINVAVSGVSVPSKLSQLSNDPHFITEADAERVASSKIGTLKIPKKISELLNDSSFATEAYVREYVEQNATSGDYDDEITELRDTISGHVQQFTTLQSTVSDHDQKLTELEDTIQNYTPESGEINQEELEDMVEEAVNSLLNGGYTNLFKNEEVEQNKRIVSSTNETQNAGDAVAYNNMSTTGFISCSRGDVIRLKGINFVNPDNNFRIAFYRSDKSYIGLVQANDAWTILGGTSAENGELEEFTVQDLAYTKPVSLADVAFFRICTKGFNADAIITRNQKIVESSGITIGNLDGVPTYAKKEAEGVTDNIMDVRTGKSLCFAALSDFHLDTTSAADSEVKTQKAVKLAAQGLKELNTLNNFDAVVMLGDYTSNNSWQTENCKKDFKQIKRDFSNSFRTQPVAWLMGNHEINYDETRDETLEENELYSYIGAGSVFMQRDVNCPEKNYGYIDFPNQQIRMICLNTADTLTTFTPVDGADFKSEWISQEQLQWLANTALDFSDKPNAAEWGIVICSHHPLNYHQNIKIALKILEAYKSGESGNISENISVEGVNYSVSVSYDFSTGEKAEVICNIHGHSHNFKYEKIGSTTDKWLWRLCVPNVCVGRENECASWSQDFGEFDTSGNPVYYEKTPDTAKGTSFCSITIDRETEKIYAHCFGAGYDREISYGGDV